MILIVFEAILKNLLFYDDNIYLLIQEMKKFEYHFRLISLSYICLSKIKCLGIIFSFLKRKILSKFKNICQQNWKRYHSLNHEEYLIYTLTNPLFAYLPHS